MNHRPAFSATDTLDRTIRLYRRHVALVVRSAVGAVLFFLVVWVLLVVRSDDLVRGFASAPVRPDVFLALAADAPGSTLAELAQTYGSPVVFFFLLQTLLSNAAVRTAATLLLGGVPAQPLLGTSATVLLVPAVVATLPLHLFGVIVADQLATTPPFVVALFRNQLTWAALPPVLLSAVPPLGVGALLLALVARLALAPQAVLLENSGPFGCFGRSWQLTRGIGMRLWCALLLLEGLIGLVTCLPLIAASFAAMLLVDLQALPTVSALAAIASQALYLALLPLPFIATTLVYAATKE